MSGSKNKTWCFIGDMTFESGFLGSGYYALTNHDLPLQFVVEDNNMSTNTYLMKLGVVNEKYLKM